MSKEELLDNLTKVITDGDASAASKVAQEIIAAGIDPLEAIQQGATKGLDIIGERFQRLEAYLPELIRGGQAMKACLAVLTPHINKGKEGGVTLDKVVIGTVPRDIHTDHVSLLPGRTHSLSQKCRAEEEILPSCRGSSHISPVGSRNRR